MLAKRKIQLNHTKPYKNDNIDDAGKYWENKIYRINLIFFFSN